MNGDKLTVLGFVMDRSGSMAVIRDDAIGGFNTFLKDQQREPNNTRMTLVLFDHEYEIRNDWTALTEVAFLDERTYVPRGNTALLDAIGRAISAIDAKTASLAPDSYQVVMVILTDGQENASSEFSYKAVAELIDRKQKGGWQFNFLGANQDVIKQAVALRIDPAGTQNFGGSGSGLRDSLSMTSESISRIRRGDSSSGGGVVH